MTFTRDAARETISIFREMVGKSVVNSCRRTGGE